MIYRQIQPKVSVATKVREYYTVNKKFGGLIQITEVLHTEKFGRDIAVFIPELQKDDTILINGMVYAPTNQVSNKENV